MRGRTLWAALLVSMLLTLGTAASATATSRAEEVRRCQENSWETLRRIDGTTFATRGECVRYAATGGSFLVVPEGCVDRATEDFLWTGAINTSPNGTFHESMNGTCQGPALVEGTLVQAPTSADAASLCAALLATRGLPSFGVVETGSSLPADHWFCSYALS